MIDHAITLYVFIAAFAGGLLSPYLTAERRQVVAATSPYRPVALALILAHCIAALLIRLEPNMGLVANTTYVSALFLVSRELHPEQRGKVKDALILGAILLLCVGCFLAIGRWTLGTTREYAYLVILTAALANLAILIAAMNELRRSRSIYMKHAIAAACAAFLIMAARLFQIYHQPDYTIGAGQESTFLFVLRLLNAVSFFVLLSAIANFHFQKLWNREHHQRIQTEDGMLESLLALAHARDNETGNHILRTKNYVRTLATHLKARGWFAALDGNEYVEQLFKAAPLHDIGKVGVPDHILLKPGRLSPEEWEIMKTHAIIGEDILKAARPQQGLSPDSADGFLAVAVEIAGAHHERWDGAGYPRGLSGEAIPKSARLMAVADIYDALTSARPYKHTWTHAEAVAEIKALAGTKLDPHVVDAFLDLQAEFLAIAERYKDDQERAAS